MLDTSRFNRIIKSYFENSTRADRLQSQYMFMYTFKIFRLVVIVFMITYFIGCFWWLIVRYINTDGDKEKGNTFISSFNLDKLYANKECLDLNCLSDDPHELCADQEWTQENCTQDFGT